MPIPYAAWLGALPWMLGAAVLTWLVSLAQRNVTIVDTLWPLLFIVAGIAYAAAAPGADARTLLMLGMVAAWGLRLALHLARRNMGHAEDRRYAAIRRRNEPGFGWKSLYLIFGLQAGLAWIISLPLLGATRGAAIPIGVLDFAGVALWFVGLYFEAVGDWQLTRFTADPANAGKVMDRGLWRWTRHPNYFGDFCVWWGLWLVALATGAWWSVAGPLVMSVLLLRVSGVSLLERHIGKRRPGYPEYMRRTNAFFPGPRRGGPVE